MAAAGTIGLVARIGGVGQLVGGLGQINAQMAGTAQGAQALGAGLGVATANFQVFQAGAQQIQTALGAVQFTANAVLTPVRAVGSALGEVAEVAGAASSRIVGVLGDIATATAALGTAGVFGIGALSTALVGGLGAAIGLAARFHQELVDLGSIGGIAGPALGQVEEAVKRAALQFAIAIPEIQRVALELIKAGVAPDALANGVLKVTLALQQLSKGELSAEQAGQGIGSLLQLFNRQFRESGQSVEEFSLRIGNAVAAVANNTRATIQEVINGVNTLAPTLTARGSDLESVFAALNVILSQGLRGEVGGTGLRNLENFLVKPSQEALKIIKELGLQDISPFDVDGNIRPALDVLRSIQKVFSEQGLRERGLTPAQGEQALSQIFQTRAATIAAIIRQVGPEKIDEFFTVFGQTNLITQANTQIETLTRQIGLLRNEAELAAIAFGSQFLGALTNAAKGVNDFLSRQAQPAAGAAGQGLMALITGQGQDEAFAGITQNIGEGAGKAFGDLFNQVDAIRPAVRSLLGDIGTLGKTLGDVVFPEGPGERIAQFGGLLQQGVVLADRFVNFLNSNLPTTGQNIASLVGEAQQFLDKLNRIVTDGQGLDVLPGIWESLQPLIATAREALDGVATNAATFVRSIIDNRDGIVGALQAFITVLSVVDNTFLAIATNVTNLVGLLSKPISFELNIISNEIDLLKRLVGGTAAAAQATAGGPLVNTNGPLFQDPRFGDRGVVGGSFSPPPPSGLTAPQQRAFSRVEEPVFGPPTPPDIQAEQDRQAASLAKIPEAARAAGSAVDAYNTILGQLAQESATATTAQQGVANSAGAVQTDMVAAARAAEQAQDAVKRANDRLSEAIEDAARQQNAAFRQLDRSLAGIEQRYNDTLESIAEQTEDSFDQITRAADKQEQDLKDAFDIRQDQQSRRDAFAIEERERRQNFEHELADDQRHRQLLRENRDTDAQRLAEDSTRQEQRRLDTISRLRQKAIDRDNVMFQRGQDKQLQIFSRGQEDAQRIFSQGFESQNTSRLRAREDTEAQRQLAEDLSKATTPEDRQRIQDQFKQAQDNRTRQRGFEDEDRQIAKQQEQALLTFRRGQEDSLLHFRQEQEDVAFNRRIQQAEDEVQFRIEQEEGFLGFRRVMEDAERQRRRIEDAKEILFRRQFEETAQNQFADEAQQRARALDFQLAQEDLDRALLKNRENEREQLTKLVEQTARRLATANRAASRESAAAQQQYNDQLTTTSERLGDIRTDIQRTTRDQTTNLNKVDPTGSGKGTADAIAALQSINGAIDRAQAVVGAGAITAQQRSEGAVQALQTRLGGLQQQADTALTGLLGQLQQLQSIAEAPGGAITITTVFNSPQAERLAIALETLTDKIDAIKPGVQIDQNVQQFTEPTTPGDALQSLRTVGGAV